MSEHESDESPPPDEVEATPSSEERVDLPSGAARDSDTPETEGEADARDEPESEGADARAKPPEGSDSKPLGRRLLAAARDVYVSTDPRSLGLFRIALGLLLVYDVGRRWPDLAAHYSNAGWLPNHFALFRPMSNHLFSLHYAFGTPGEVKVAVALQLLAAVLFTIGWRTKTMHVVSAVLITSLNSRTIMLENGGYVVLNLLCVWSLFLPLGRRFSLDALLASMRARREPSVAALRDRSWPRADTSRVVALAVTALLLQYAVIYYFNTVHKTADVWHAEGTAVYYFFQQDRMVTPLGAWLRGSMPLAVVQALTWSTLVIEGTLVVILLQPFKSLWIRPLGWLLACGLHLSIELVVQLGPFSWAMVIVWFVFLAPEHWAWLERRARRRAVQRRLIVAGDDGFSLAFARLVKRLDTLELVSFVDRAEASAAEREKSRAALLVTDASGAAHYTGVAALRALTASMAFRPRFFWLWLPGVSHAVDALVARWFADSAKRAERLGLDDLPGSEDAAPPVDSGFQRFWRRARGTFATACVGVLLVAATSQVLIENRAVPAAIKLQESDRPEWLQAVVVYPRLFQGWSMFAPGPPMEDGRVVVDGRTADGRKLDPLTGREPSWEVQPADGFRMNQIWGDFHRRIGEARFSAYHNGFRDMLRRYHEITGKPEDRLVAFDVWYITEQIPPPGEASKPARRRKMFSFGNINRIDGQAVPPGRSQPRPKLRTTVPRRVQPR